MQPARSPWHVEARPEPVNAPCAALVRLLSVLDKARTRYMKQSLVIVAGVLCASLVHAANWPQWRGPNFDGSSTETGLPSQFSKTENVAWTVPLPGPSGSTPAIFGDYVFVSSTDKEKKSRVAMALDRKTGQTRWQRDMGPGVSQDDRSNYSSPSPITDGKNVW